MNKLVKKFEELFVEHFSKKIAVCDVVILQPWKVMGPFYLFLSFPQLISVFLSL